MGSTSNRPRICNQPSDRGSTYCHDALHQTWRSRVDQHFPDRPLTKKPAEVRMGSGKGSPEFWVANVKPGRVMFELSGVSEEVAREALRLAAHKLPLKARIVRREGGE